MRSQGTLDLNEALQHPGRKIRFDVNSRLGPDADVELIDSVQGGLEAVSTGNLLLLSGEFTAGVIVPCARCGSPLEAPVSFEIDEQFAVEGVAACYGTGDQARVVADEPFPLFEGNSLILDALLRQSLIVSLPIQPLCKFGWDLPCPNDTAPHQLGGDVPGRTEFQKLKNLIEPTEDERP